MLTQEEADLIRQGYMGMVLHGALGNAAKVAEIIAENAKREARIWQAVPGATF